jgi:hypothetical protein
MKRLLWAISFALATVVPVLGEGTRPSDTLLDTSTGTKILIFIPESVLNREVATGLRSLSLDAQSNERILDRIRSSPESGSAENPQCSTGVLGAIAPGQSTHVPDGVAALQTRSIVVAGRVDRLVVGMEANGEVATLVHVRVARVLKGVFSVHVGDDITFLEHIGRLAVAGREMCNTKRKFTPVATGDEVVVGGMPDAHNPGHLLNDERYLFFVQNGKVVPARRGSAEAAPPTIMELDHRLNPELSR